MRVAMKQYISGGRGDGRDWPPAGVPFDVGDDEGIELCRNGLAIPLPSDPGPPVETRDEDPGAPADPGPAAGPEPELPDPKAPKADWVAYAVSRGAEEAEASLLTKADLIDRYSPKAPE